MQTLQELRVHIEEKGGLAEANDPCACLPAPPPSKHQATSVTCLVEARLAATSTHPASIQHSYDVVAVRQAHSIAAADQASSNYCARGSQLDF